MIFSPKINCARWRLALLEPLLRYVNIKQKLYIFSFQCLSLYVLLVYPKLDLIFMVYFCPFYSWAQIIIQITWNLKLYLLKLLKLHFSIKSAMKRYYFSVYLVLESPERSWNNKKCCCPIVLLQVVDII